MTAPRISPAARPVSLTFAALLTLTISGCSEPPVSGTLPGPDPGSEQVERTCEVGHWTLDVPHYEAQIVEFSQGLDLHIEGYALSGSGQLDIATDGVIDATTEMRSTGTIVAPGASVPFDESGNFTHSGRWEPGKVAGTIDLDAWDTVEGEGNSPFSPTSPTPMLEFTGIPTVTSTCDDETLLLSNPESPFTTLWHRS